MVVKILNNLRKYCNLKFCEFSNLKIMKKITAILLILTAYFANGQDTHYQTQQFGTRSALLGGAVVGGVRDNTALFYNPGSLGFIDTAMVSINANLYKVENIKILNAVGEQADFKTANFVTVPLLIAGMLPSKNPRLKWGYGLGGPMHFTFNGNGRVDGPYSIVNDAESPGEENYTGQAQVKTKSNETLAGLGLGYRLNKNWSVGLTNQITIRSVEYTNVVLSRFYLNNQDLDLVSSNIWKSTKYNHWRYAAKFGIAYTNKNWDMGLTLTTPSVTIYGKGNVSSDITANDILFNGVRRDIYANDSQEKLKTNYKAPLKIGSGINFRSGKSVIGISGEYCGSVEVYDVITAKPGAFVRPPELAPNFGSENYLKVKSAAKSVLNLAIGYEYKLKETMSLMFGLRTDNSWYDSTIQSQIGIKPEITTWDIYHFSGGVSIVKGRTTISLGLLLGVGGDNDYYQGNNLDEPSEGTFLQGLTTITEAKYSSFGALVGFSFNFKKF